MFVFDSDLRKPATLLGVVKPNNFVCARFFYCLFFTTTLLGVVKPNHFMCANFFYCLFFTATLLGVVKPNDFVCARFFFFDDMENPTTILGVGKPVTGQGFELLTLCL